MSRTSRFLILAMLLILGLAFQAEAAPTSRVVDQQPLSFEENRGQTDSRVKYLARTGGWSLFLTSTEAVLALRDGGPVRLAWTGGSTEPRIQGEEELPAKVNYLVGDASRWRSGVPTWSRVRYSGIYPGIDLVFYGDGGRLEYDVVVAPGADPKSVRLAVGGADRLSVDPASGELVLKLAGSEMRLSKPVSYQDVDGTRREVASRYRLLGTKEVGFEVAEWDRSRPLVIDPVLVYSTFLGGSDHDSARGVAADAAGNVWVVGATTSVDFPLEGALKTSKADDLDVDAFIVKLDREGNLVFATYFGGDSSDLAEDVALDSRGNAYIVGTSQPVNFPTVNALPSPPGLSWDVFLAKLDPTGSTVLLSTLLGGSGVDWGRDVAVDLAGDAYLTGRTTSNDFPRVRAQPKSHGDPASDAFVIKLSPEEPRIVYSTLLGGSAEDEASGIAVDAWGHAVVTGATYSRDFPMVRPLHNALTGSGPDPFITRFSPQGGSLLFSTYLPGAGDRSALTRSDIAVDANGNMYATGLTSSMSFPLLHSLKPASNDHDVYVVKITPGGELVYSTRFGGWGWNYAESIAVDRTGAAYVGGFVQWGDFPLKDAVRGGCSGPVDDPCIDPFVFKLSALGPELVYSTRIGSDETPDNWDYTWEVGHALAVDGSGNAYLVGETAAKSFPVLNAAQPTHGGGYTDGFVVKIGSSNGLPVCSGASASPAVIWPPNGKMVPISTRGVTDPDGDPVTIKIIGITQDEPGAAFSGIGSSVARVKAERAGKGDGRVYHILFEASDPSGASCTGEVTVCVPHDRGKGGCVDGAP